MILDYDPAVEFQAGPDPASLTAGPPCPLCGRALDSALMRRLESDDEAPGPDECDLTVNPGAQRRLELEPCGCRVRLGGAIIPEVEVHKDRGHLLDVGLDRGDGNVYFRVLHVPDRTSQGEASGREPNV
jgi:hypothetical protein